MRKLRFILAVLENTSFRNCNLKKSIFQSSVRKNVSFKMSNTREAEFIKDDIDSMISHLSDEELSNTHDNPVEEQ